MKQYIPKKPKRWGIKVISRNGIEGFTHDFMIYDGKSPKVKESCGFQAGDLVLKVCESLPKNKNHIVYFDSFFNSVELQLQLKKDGIHSVGTLQKNRLRGCVLRSEKDLRRMGRGSFDCRTERDSRISIVRWYDNRVVQLSSTYMYVSIDPISKVQRFDRKTRKKLEVQCPAIVKEYNQHMGGVDKFDMLMSLYRCDHKSKKWYRPIFLWCINLCLVNAWLHYKRDCSTLDISQNAQMDLLSFSAKVSHSLVLGKKGCDTSQSKRQRGRPSSAASGDTNECSSPPPKRREASKPKPQADIRTDQVAHWPSCNGSC